MQDQRGQSAPVPAGTMVCVQPSGRFGVAVTTTVDGKNVLEQTIVADGSAQPLSQATASGTQTSNWSRDGERLFTRVELECAEPAEAHRLGHHAAGERPLGRCAGDGHRRQCRRAAPALSPHERSVCRRPAGMTTAPLSVEDVIEASAKVQSEALEAALDEANARFALNSRVLTQLADNGVSPNVIDLLVAQAYPEKFEVRAQRLSVGVATVVVRQPRRWAARSVYMGSTMYPSPMYDPFYSSYYYYSPFAYPYYWGPSYSYYGYGSPFYRNYYNYNYYGLGGGGLLRRRRRTSGRPGGGNAQPGDPRLARRRRGRRQRPRLHASETGRIEQYIVGHRRERDAHEPHGWLHARRSQRRQQARCRAPAPSSSSSELVFVVWSSSSGASSGGYSSGGGGDSGGGGRTAQPR